MANPFNRIKTPISLLILTPDEFLDALAPLVAYKNQIGMAAATISITDIYGYFQGADQPEKIKRAIQYGFENKNTKYVMLVGDASKFPVRYFFMQQVPLYPNDDFELILPIPCEPPGQFVQSDLYYANLYHHTSDGSIMVPSEFDNWDQNANNLYNEASISAQKIWPHLIEQFGPTFNPDNVDGYPDLAVGRIPAYTSDHVTTYVDKIINYGNSASYPVGIPLKFTFVADANYDNEALLTKEVADESSLEGNNGANIFRGMYNNGGTTAPNGFTNLSAVELEAAAGASTWLSFIGQGDYGKWDGFDQSNVNNILNSKNLPIVFAAAANSGAFTATPPWGTQNFTDLDGNVRGPFLINPSAAPGRPGLVVSDLATGEKWGIGEDYTPLPVAIPTINPISSPNADVVQSFATAWLFKANGGGIAYFGEHCKTDEKFGAYLEKNMLQNYAPMIQGGSAAILGDIYLKAQQKYYYDHQNDSNLPAPHDYHSLPRLYLGWMGFYGDPSLLLPVYKELKVRVYVGNKLFDEVVLDEFGRIQVFAGNSGKTITYKSGVLSN